MIIQNTVETLSKLDATNCSSEVAIAQYILRNMKGYKLGNAFAGDVQALSVYIQAYAKMLQDHDVKVVDYQI